MGPEPGLVVLAEDLQLSMLPAAGGNDCLSPEGEKLSDSDSTSLYPL